MEDNMSHSPLRMSKQTRSASICATTGSIETAINSMSMGATNGGGGGGGSGYDGSGDGTPGYRRRRPATRTQSARITTGGRSVRRRQVQQQQQQQQQIQHNLQHIRSYCTSEPRLSETETPPQSRKLSQRRPQTHVHRKSNAFLDVPNMHHLRVSGDDGGGDLDRLRTFSASKGGIINRGDSFRRRRSRSNSLAPASPINPRSASGNSNASNANANCDGNAMGHHQQSQQHHQQQQQQQQQQQPPVEVFRVEMLGSAGVGKKALTSQFRTSDCINAYDGPECDEAEQNISIILNGIESELKFSIGQPDNKEQLEKADAFLVVYSCIDKESFTRAKQILSRLQDMDLIRLRPIILVANKIDLARSRSVSAQDGKCVSCTFGAKFIEVSVGINHNVDELLAGTLTQIRLKKEHNLLQSKKTTERLSRIDTTTNNKKSKAKKMQSHPDVMKEKEKEKDKYQCDGYGYSGDDGGGGANKTPLSPEKQKRANPIGMQAISEQNLHETALLDPKHTDDVGHRENASSPAHWYKSRSVVLASMKARQMLTWILGKEDSKFKHCENLQVL